MDEQSDPGSFDEGSEEGKKKTTAAVPTKKVSALGRALLKKLQVKVQMRKHPSSAEIVEWWVLKAYFGTDDQKTLFKIRD